MQDDVIKRALEVAAKALCFGHDGQDCDMCAAPEHCYKSHVFLRKDAAAAIAAFLDAPDIWEAMQLDHEAVIKSIKRMAGGEG